MFSFVEPSATPTSEHERILAIEERHHGRARASLPRGRHPARRPRCARPPASSTSRPGSPARSATASSPPARTPPTTRRAAWTPGSGPRPTPRREPMHTLNGTAVAVSRALIALIENGQREDGSVAMPQALVDAGRPGADPGLDARLDHPHQLGAPAGDLDPVGEVDGAVQRGAGEAAARAARSRPRSRRVEVELHRCRVTKAPSASLNARRGGARVLLPEVQVGEVEAVREPGQSGRRSAARAPARRPGRGTRSGPR